MRTAICCGLVFLGGCNALFGLDAVALDDGDGGTSTDARETSTDARGTATDAGGPDAGPRLPTRVPVCAAPRALIAATVDTSDALDLITTCVDRLGVTLSTGARQYAGTSSIALTGLIAVAVGDVNEDGNNDLGVAVTGALQLYSGSGDGGFGLVQTVGRSDILDLEIGDLLGGDGAPDIAAATPTAVQIYPQSRGTLGNPQLVAQAQTRRIALVDLDDDNRLDLAIAGSNDTITVRLQSSGYAAATSHEVGGGALAAGELLSDAGDELAVATIAAPTVAITFPSSGGLATGPPAMLAATATAVAVGDLDRDGLGDVAVTSSVPQVELFFNNGANGLTRGPTLPLDAVPADVVIADLDGDLHGDVAVAIPTLGEVWIYWGPF